MSSKRWSTASNTAGPDDAQLGHQTEHGPRKKQRRQFVAESSQEYEAPVSPSVILRPATETSQASMGEFTETKTASPLTPTVPEPVHLGVPPLTNPTQMHSSLDESGFDSSRGGWNSRAQMQLSVQTDGRPPSGTTHIRRPSTATDYDDGEVIEVLQTIASAQFPPGKTDCYSVTASDEEDMARMVDFLSPQSQKSIPLPSVINDLDVSSTAEVFDASLQRYSPTIIRQTGDIRCNSKELLDSDVKGDNVLENAQCPQKKWSHIHRCPLRHRQQEQA
ncbi:hypothetical protein B0T26DRAFT_407110 [Lasiosphaeria miniovina]|uniref:Uncharacterized protein n=1 Tax=Lasiosphaeria miniovina TaxID=1954250 RepID=A0AA40A567_9PEZI|nr:uncharacterized protein B0T26DRAFT_407110 [Lasiosphaeria miniovina]KAK0709465.1 hypothetical protein B0T26DRAFT_407110 [Lasiosphaeria miniovina]